MRAFDLVVFDLDGTLIDSKQDLACAVNATRAELGLAPLDQEVISSYVGNGAPVLIRKVLGPEAPEEQVTRALEFFLQYYRDHPLDHTTLYDGVTEALHGLTQAGARMAVLTNKPVRISQAIVDGLGVGTHFFRVYGGNSFEQKKPHRMGLDRLVEEADTTAARTLMVGDSYVDIRTARNAGTKAAGCTWGFQPESLVTDPPDYVIEQMTELLDIVSPNA